MGRKAYAYMFLGAQKNLLIEMVLLSTHNARVLNEKPRTRSR